VTRLDIISDPVCPWCYIGAANLTRAIEAVGGAHPFAIRWRPYQLNPDMPADGMDRADYLAAKFGGSQNAARVYEKVEAAAAEAGLKMNFARIARAPNTLDAHRVIRWAGAEGVQTRLTMALFLRYFEKGEDLSDARVLCAAAEQAGLDGEVIARLLAGDADRAEVRKEAAAARESGVTGVPTFIIGGTYALIGAQPIETWARIQRGLEAAAIGDGV
jgi:predicted DsbA family dithiol-disulfide isomerase